MPLFADFFPAGFLTVLLLLAVAPGIFFKIKSAVRENRCFRIAKITMLAQDKARNDNSVNAFKLEHKLVSLMLQKYWHFDDFFMVLTGRLLTWLLLLGATEQMRSFLQFTIRCWWKKLQKAYRKRHSLATFDSYLFKVLETVENVEYCIEMYIGFKFENVNIDKYLFIAYFRILFNKYKLHMHFIITAFVQTENVLLRY